MILKDYYQALGFLYFFPQGLTNTDLNLLNNKKNKKKYLIIDSKLKKLFDSRDN